MKSLISAIQFLTIVPVTDSESFDPEKAIPFFPVTGLLIGILLAVFDLAILRFWPEPVVAVLDVVFLAVITGALHLDVLGDTADGLYGQWLKYKALEIMKDSRIGTMGLVAIISCLAVKWGGIAVLGSGRSLLLIIVPAYARSAMIFGFKFLEYGRPDGGTGLLFFRKKIKPKAFIGLLFPVVLSFFLGWKGLWLNVFFVFTVAILII